MLVILTYVNDKKMFQQNLSTLFKFQNQKDINKNLIALDGAFEQTIKDLTRESFWFTN